MTSNVIYFCCAWSPERINAAISWPPTDIQEGLDIYLPSWLSCPPARALTQNLTPAAMDIYLTLQSHNDEANDWILCCFLILQITKQMIGFRVGSLETMRMMMIGH